MTAATMTRERFDLGRVIQRTFSVLGRNFASFYLLALVVTGAPALLLGWLNLARGGTGRRQLLASGQITPAVIGIWLVALVISLVTYFLLQGALTWGTVADLNGRKATAPDMLRAGLRSWLPLLGLTVCFGLAVAVGWLLIIVPALIMVTMWAVVAPSLIVEKTSVFGAFTRSRNLTRGNRWAVFGLLVIYFIGAAVVSMTAGSVISVVFYGGLNPTQVLGAMGSPGSYIGALLSVLLSTLLRVVGAVGAAVLYYELRSAKEGVGPEALADVFS